jgi:hypothetical protein
VVEELIALRTVVSYTVEWVLECSLGEASRVEVMGKLATKFQGLEETCSRLEGPSEKICSLLLGPLSGQSYQADRLDEVAEWLEATLAERRQADAELEALRTSAAFVRDLILGDASGSSSLAMSLVMVAEEVEKRVNVATTNGVWWGTQSTLVAALSHFPKLEPELELLGSEQDADLSDGQTDALWPLVSVASNSLASLVPSSLAHDPPNIME